MKKIVAEKVVRPWPDHFFCHNFFHCSLLLKVIAHPRPPYDSTSALHGLATFQKPTTTLPEHDFWHFRSSEQRADGTYQLATYDFVYKCSMVTLGLDGTVVKL